MTVQELREMLAQFKDDAEVAFYLSGADRLTKVAVFAEPYDPPTLGTWPHDRAGLVKNGCTVYDLRTEHKVPMIQQRSGTRGTMITQQMTVTRREAEQVFRASILPLVVRVHGDRDRPAKRKAWNDFTNWLHKHGWIDTAQCDTWLGSFS